MEKKNNSGLSEEARLERNRYHRDWCASHPEKVREIDNRYWRKRAARVAAQRAAEKNAEEVDHGEEDEKVI